MPYGILERNKTRVQVNAVKIDSRLKNRLRFNQLDGETKQRLRRFYHLTSADVALRILQSGFIWSNADDLSPNFATNRTVKPDFGGRQEVCLTFNFMGPVYLVAQEFPASEYVPNALYVHLLEWPDLLHLDSMRIERLRVSQGTSVGLQCTGFNATAEFLERCKTDIEANLLLNRVRRLAALSRSMRVPASPDERNAVQSSFLDNRFSTLDVQKMKFSMWKRRLLKRFNRSAH